MALAEWLAAAARRDADALAVIYGMTSSRLLAVLIRLLGRRELAEDILHDVFLRVWDRAASFDPDRGSAMGWLVAVARNCALDHLRRQRREQVEAAVDPDGIADPDSGAATSMDRRALQLCLDRLEPEPRRCVVLAYQGGLSYDELAALMQRPSGTVKSWVRRSLQRLRRCLEGQ